MSNPFTKAREKRGWSLTAASRRMPGVSEQQLRNLEGIGATRSTRPAHVRVRTACVILEAYWPDVSLRDFVEETDLKVVAAGLRSERRLKAKRD